TLHASPPALRRLCDNLAHWAFTDFDRARGALVELADQIGPRTSFELRLSYHQSAAFLENQWQHYDRALGHCQQAIAILESLADSTGLVEMWADTAAVYLNGRQWEMAQECLDNARQYATDATPARLRANMDCREGFLHLHLGNTNDALDRLLKAKDLLRDIHDGAPLKDFYLLTLTLSGLGDLYERVNEMDKSLQAFSSVLPIVERHQLRPRLAWHYLSAGRVAFAGKDLASARASFEGVLRYAGEGDSEARTHALANLGIIASIDGEVPRARSLFDQAAAMYVLPTKPSDFTNLSRIETFRAGLLTQSGDYEGAKALLEKAYDIGLKGQDLFHLEHICSTMAQVHEELDDYAGAYRWQLLSTDYTAQHFRQLHNREREEIEVRHQLERSRQEAQMARLRVSGLQLRALRAQMNPHFMFNVLNAIQGLVTSGRNS
ncbi:MAG TPA: histidine kinase, partial [Saprospiraceae bacterium]|nr:histidine kinase [Saprospiraceae bacterium]